MFHPFESMVPVTMRHVPSPFGVNRTLREAGYMSPPLAGHKAKLRSTIVGFYLAVNAMHQPTGFIVPPTMRHAPSASDAREDGKNAVQSAHFLPSFG